MQHFLDEPLKSLEDMSAELVKDTLVKVLSGVVSVDDGASSKTESLIDSPSRMILVQSKENIENSEFQQLIDTPSKLNLGQINDCYAETNETNENTNQAPTSNRAEEYGTVTSESEFRAERSTSKNANTNQDEKRREEQTGDAEEQTKSQKERNDNMDHKEENEEGNTIEEKKLQEEHSNAMVLSAKELYSSSSSHLCSKLSETLQNTDPSQTAVQHPAKALDLSGHDLRTSVRYLKTFSGCFLIPLCLSHCDFVWSFIDANESLIVD